MNTVDLSQFYAWLNAGALVILTALAGAAVVYLRAWASSHAAWMDADTRTKLVNLADQAMKNGISWAMKLLEDEEKRHEAVQFPGGVKGWMLAKGAQYAADHAGPEIDKLGWSANDVAQKLTAKLPPAWTLEDVSSSAAVRTQRVTVQPLAPAHG